MKLKHIISIAMCLVTLAFAASAVSIETVSVTPPASNGAPIAENISLTTYRGVTTSGQLTAVDPEGDIISYRILSQPMKGEVVLSDDGAFTYTPLSGKKGRDCFTYTANDNFGNVSEPATVSIMIEKQSVKVAYCDMDGNGAYYSAIRLAERGIFIGQRLGSSYCFSPASTVSRSEFLAMCSALTGLEPLSGITRTGFYDDGDISVWLKPYVSAALMCGAVHGYCDENGSVVFAPDAPITHAEAAVMLNNFLEISDVRHSAGDGEVPVWAAQAVSNLSACDIYTGSRSDTALTRADAAKMLGGAMDLLDIR